MIFRLQRFLVPAIGIVLPLSAQFGPAPGGNSGTRAQQVPLSGRTQSSSVSVGQTTTGGAGGRTVNTLNSTVQVEGDIQGSVPGGPAAGSPLALSLAQAISRGLQYNLSTLASANAQREANAGRLNARAQLLPDINGDVRETLQQIDLAAAGFRFAPISLGPGQPTFSFPNIVGPFNYFDVRANISQSVVDLTRIHNYRSSKETARSAALTALDTRELIVLAVTGAYLQIIARQSSVDTARAQIATAELAHTQAVDRNKSGLNARIDVNRSLVELQTQQQRLHSVLNDLAKAKIGFSRLIGLPQSQQLALTDRQPFNPQDKVPAPDELIKLAWDQRPDVRAAAGQVHAAEEAKKAATSEYLPSLSFNADYGVIGVNPAQSHGTFSVTGTLHVPIYRSGRIEADVQQASAALSLRRAELEDIKGRAEQDVRNALLDVDTANEQIRLAESNRHLAADTLEQAGDRFRAGLADTIELVQAQESLATSEQDYISAMFAYQLARAGLARATGEAEKSIH